MPLPALHTDDRPQPVSKTRNLAAGVGDGVFYALLLIIGGACFAIGTVIAPRLAALL